MNAGQTTGTSTPIPSSRDALRYMRRLAILIRPHWRGIFIGVLLGLPVGLLGMIAPYLSKLFIDEVYPARDVSFMHVLVIGILAVSLTTSLMSALRGYYSQVIGARLGSAVSLMYFNHLQHLPVRFFDEHRVGEIMSRFSALRASVNALSSMLETIISGGVYLLIVPPFLLLMNWKLAVVCMITVPITTLIATLSARVRRRFILQGTEVNAELSAFQIEVLSNIRTLKALTAEHHVFTRTRTQLQSSLRLQLVSAGIGSLISFLNGLVRMLGMGLFTWYAWTMILSNELSLGGFVAFSAYLGYLTGPISQFAGLFSGFQQTAVTLGRAFEYLDLTPERASNDAVAPPQPLSRTQGTIRIERLSFGYRQDRLVLRDVSLQIERGVPTAVVGASGAGKSSLVRLLVRMIEPDRGQISLDGVPIMNIPLGDLRRHVGVVWQEVALLRGSVWDNLTFGIPDPDRETVEHAVRVCRLETFIRELPEGFETPVAEWGATLSGGQRQRLTIARAMIRQPSVLLLDEATSQVDVDTENQILRELLAHTADRTVLFVTHRVGTARLAEQICVLEDGRVAGVGSHRDLSERCDVYQRLLDANSQASARRPLQVLAPIGS